MQISKAHKGPWLGIALWVLLGGWITWDQVSSYLERGHPAYILMAAGYALFTLLMCTSFFMDDPANRERFTRRQLFIAKLVPFVALGLVFIGLWWRLGGK